MNSSRHLALTPRASRSAVTYRSLCFGIMLLAACAPRCWSALVFSENFDGTAILPVGWTFSSDVGASWSLTTVTNHTFPNAAWVSPPNGYGTTDLTSPPIFIPTPIARLTFRHSYHTVYYWERGSLQISIAGGPFADILNPGGSFVTNGYSPGDGWKGSSGGFIFTDVRIPASASGQSVQLRWRFTSESSGSSSSGGEWFVDTISISDGLSALPDDVSVSVFDSPDPVAIGADLTYVITVTNTGPSPASAVLLTNALPAGVTFVSATPSSGTCSNIGGVLVCGFGNVPGQSAATLTVVVRPTATGLLTNRASVFRGEPDTYTLNNVASATTLAAQPALYVGNVTANEGSAGTSIALFAVHLSPPSTQTVTVNYSTTNLTALAGSDYQSHAGLLTFAPGENLKIVSVPIFGDTLDETNELFLLKLSNATNAIVMANNGTATIVDDDQPPALFVLDSVIVEGNAGTRSALFSLYLTAPSAKTVSLTYTLYDGSARSPSDYLNTNGTVLLPPGTTVQTVAVPVIGDLNVEPGEYFTLQVYSVKNADFAGNSAFGWILNDDGLPGQLHHFSWNEITGPLVVGQPTAVTLTAEDYFNHPISNFTNPVPLSANASGNSHILISPTNHDSFSSSFETVGYSFTPNTNLVVTHVRHYSGTKVSIWNDSGILLASQPVASVPGTWMETALSTPITLSRGATYRIGVLRGGSVLYQRDVTPTSFKHGTISEAYYGYGDEFPPYSASSMWLVDLRYVVGALPTVPIIPSVTGNFVNGVWSGSMTIAQYATNVVLLADDGQGHTGRSNPFDVSVTDDISLTLSATPDPVGVGANLSYRVVVTNTGPSAANGVTVTNVLPASVTFLSAVSSQGSWTNLGGIVIGNLGTLPTASPAELIITVVAGGVGTLTNLATASRMEADFFPGNNTASVVTMVVPPTLTVSDAAAVEGNSGLAPITFNVRLSPASGQAVSVHFATTGDSATTGDDFIEASGTLFFAPGQTNQTITVYANCDFLNEIDEAFLLALSTPTNATLALSQSVGRIWNDDPLPSLLLYGASVNEGNAGRTHAFFEVSLTAPSGQTVSANYYTSAGTAQAPADFMDTNGTLVFPPGTTTRTIAVPVNGDAVIENTEVFIVSFSTLENATLGNSAANGFIVNDDGLPGQVHHFTWAQIPSPQFLGEPMAVTITARDAFENMATSFTGPVSLSARAVTAETDATILDSPSPSGSYNSDNYTLGYAFTPATDLLVTHMRHYYGSKVSIWTDDGTLLVSQIVVSSPGTWEETPLASPVTLFAGERYRVGVYANSGFRFWRNDGPSVFNHGTIDQGYYWYMDGFPQYPDSARWWFVDLRYTVQTLLPVAITPNVTTSFVGGQWTGPISVLQPGSKLLLRVDDSHGNMGVSNPFAAAGVRLGISPIGSKVLLHWPSVMTGFVLESTAGLSNSPTWVVITNAPAIVGGQNVITNPVSEGQSLFRLKTL